MLPLQHEHRRLSFRALTEPRSHEVTKSRSEPQKPKRPLPSFLRGRLRVLRAFVVVLEAHFIQRPFHSSCAARRLPTARNKKPRSRPGFGVRFARNSTQFTRCARSPARQADGVSRVGVASGAKS